MTNNTCPRCASKFYTAISGTDLNCPFCGYLLKHAESKKRAEERSVTSRVCRISKNGVSFTAQMLDISKGGVGLRISEDLSIREDDILKVIIKDFDIESNAKVVWVAKGFQNGLKTGLKFCESPFFKD